MQGNESIDVLQQSACLPGVRKMHAQCFGQCFCNQIIFCFLFGIYSAVPPTAHDTLICSSAAAESFQRVLQQGLTSATPTDLTVRVTHNAIA